MNDIYEMLKDKLQTMRDEKNDSISFDYYEVAQLYQMVCFMKQIREIVKWGE